MLQAFADDFVLVVAGSSRRDLEERSSRAIKDFTDWVDSSQLQLAQHKSVAVVFGPLSRPPTLRCGDVRIRTKTSARYLGVILDNKLSWIPHVKRQRQMAVVASHRLMKMRGVAPELLRLWYKAVIARRLLYGAAIWAPTANAHVWRHLESTQRIFLLLVTRAYRSTSTVALQVLAGVQPLRLQAEREAAVSRFLRLNYDVGGARRTDFEEYDHSYAVHPALEHLDFEVVDPPVRIFTDGSKSEKGTGAAYVVYYQDGVIHHWQRRLRQENSIFQAELAAITCAVDWVAHASLGDCCIYTDSEASLKAILNMRHPSQAVRKVQRMIREAPTTIAIKWIKAHVGFVGNEIADLLARRAVDDISTLDLYVKSPASLFKRVQWRTSMEKWQRAWTASPQGRDLYECMPQVSLEFNVVERPLVIYFSGHGPFPAHLARHQRITSSLCHCGQEGTRMHYTVACPATKKWHLRAPGDAHHQAWSISLWTTPGTRLRLMGLMKFLTREEEALRHQPQGGGINVSAPASASAQGLP